MGQAQPAAHERAASLSDPDWASISDVGSVVFLAAALQKRRHHAFCLPIANEVNGDRNGAKRGQSRAQAGGRRSGEARGKERHNGSKKQWVPDVGGKKAARVSAETRGGMRRHLVGCVVLRDILV